MLLNKWNDWFGFVDIVDRALCYEVGLVLGLFALLDF